MDVCWTKGYMYQNSSTDYVMFSLFIVIQNSIYWHICYDKMPGNQLCHYNDLSVQSSPTTELRSLALIHLVTGATSKTMITVTPWYTIIVSYVWHKSTLDLTMITNTNSILNIYSLDFLINGNPQLIYQCMYMLVTSHINQQVS